MTDMITAGSSASSVIRIVICMGTPIEVPPLRERKEDILMLVEYFVQRFASKAGKNITSIDQKALDVLQSYDWPGNIRELQNIIERSVILTLGEVLSVDELWLSKQTSRSNSMAEAAESVTAVIERQTERQIIEKALAETRGRVSGPSGAAAKLRIPASTLATRIKALRINRSQYKFVGQGIPGSPGQVRSVRNSRNSRNSGI